MATIGSFFEDHAELAENVARQCHPDDQHTLSLVSRFWWSQARIYVWQTATASSVIALVVGLHPVLDQHDEPEFDGDYIRKWLSGLTDSLSLSRFLIYAPYIRTLAIHDGAVLNEPLSKLLRDHLEVSKQPLLPNLQSLLVLGPNDFRSDDPMHIKPSGWGDSNDRPICDTETLVFLFLSPTVRTLGLFCQFLAVAPDLIATRSPNIADLRLGYADEISTDDFTAAPHRRSSSYDPVASKDILGPGIRVERILGEWPRTCLATAPRWRSLSSLTISGNFLGHVKLGYLSEIDDLAFLRIIGPYNEIDWQVMLEDNFILQRLHELVLERTPPSIAKNIFASRSLMTTIKRLTWLPVLARSCVFIGGRSRLSSPEANCLATAIINLSHSARLLEELKSTFVDKPSIETLVALRSLPLKCLCMHIQGTSTYDPQVNMELLTGANSNLTSLDIEGLALKAHQLPDLAKAYPFLSHLRLNLCVPDNNEHKNLAPSVEAPPVHHPPLQGIEIWINLRRRATTKEEARAWMGRVDRCVSCVWPEYGLTISCDG